MSENIYAKLMAIQAELVVPKTRYNQFAKNPFYYRNAEDILSAAKPVCHKHGCVLLLTDSPVNIGNRYYIEATALLTDGVGTITVTASAREEESRKGFDCAQLTGSASSYARKYALNGLLGLDDNEDPDSKDNRQLQQKNTEHTLICPRCGRDVNGFTGMSGKWHSPEQVMQNYGVCVDCYREMKTHDKA